MSSGQELVVGDDLWRRRLWRRPPAARPVRGGIEAACALTLAYSYVVNRLVPEAWYVPANLTAAAGFVALARGTGATWTDLGLRSDRVGRGLRVGLTAAVPIAAVVAIGIVVPETRRYFADQRVMVGRGTALFDTLVRIPLGTAFCEELIFRGAILGMLLRRRTPIEATAISALLFGLWHVFPTLDTLHLNPVGTYVEGDWIRTTGAVAGAICVTAAAGLGFAWLRLRANSVVASMIAHGALNVAAFVGGRAVVTIMR
ncbi:MAG TPA: CPBP family intramembrane glutamic endopeptidase [Actinomycetota bacterium]|nr:CPBP family intramembrane glutamic endopeptidase [Actinomycetota bacterium]